MTALNTVQHADAMHVLTDGARYDIDGRFVGFSPKVWSLPHINAVVSSRGPRIFLPAIVEMLGCVGTSFDDLKEKIVPFLRKSWDTLLDHADFHDFGPDADVVVAGLSETRGPEAYLITSHENYGRPSWLITDMEGLSIAPGNEEIHAEVLKLFPPGTQASEIDPVRDGIRLMEIQRNAIVPVAGAAGRELRTVGGFIQLTSVTADGISSRIIHRWNDRVGERLDVGLAA
jgi:hypothetical protein